jgi:GT2 family glycosyltransferase
MSNAVIICTRNRAKDLNELLETLNLQSVLPSKILIVDSSTTKTEIRYEKLPRIRADIDHVVSTPGLTIQRNVGLALTKDDFDFIHFFDDDVLLGPDYLEITEETFREHAEVVGICGRTPDNPVAVPRIMKRLFLLDSKKSGKLLKSGINVGFRDQRGAYPVDWLPGCCMSYRAKTIGITKFDETRLNVGWGEDVDFSARISNLGNLICQPKLSVFHKLSAINRDSQNTRFVRDLESRFKLAKVSSIKVNKIAILWSLVGLILMNSFKLTQIVLRNISSSARNIFHNAKLLIKSLLRGAHNSVGHSFYLAMDIKREILRLWFCTKAIVSGNFKALEDDLRGISFQAFCVKLTGGVGNQLFGWAIGVNLASKHNVPALFDITAFNSRNPREFGLVDLQIQTTRKTNLRNASNKVLESSLKFDPSILDAQVGSCLEGYFQSFKYFEESSHEIREILLDLRDKHQGWFNQVGPFNAIQYRRGDYLSPHNRNFHGVLDDEYFVSGADVIRKKSTTQNFIIFSDSMEHALDLTAKIGNSSVDLVADSPLDTLLRMSFATNFVISNSTFGWWSAWLGDSEAENTLVPPFWIRSQELNLNEIYLPNWRILH